jgi:hypothetical protein
MDEEHPDRLTCTIELKPGEQLKLPQALIEKVGPGRWKVTMEQCPETATASASRRHDAFLSGYSPADEGLYDDLGG